MKKAAPYILLLLMAVLVIFLKKCKDDNSPEAKNKTSTASRKEPASEVNRDSGFDRRISYLEYSNHASCRMKCRHITQKEVEYLMQNGKINYNKSDIKNTRCPRYAVEGITVDNQKVRIVFAQCNEKTNVVTVIDLDIDWTCDCPGDDAKYENKN